MPRLRTLAVVLAVSAMTVSGCAGGSDEDAADTPSPSPTAGSQTPTDSASPTAPDPSSSGPSDSASPSATPTFPNDRIEAANLHVAVLDSSTASSADEKDAVKAWMAFWQGAADTFYYRKPTADFDAVARGQARSSIVTYMEGKKRQDERVVGWAKDNVTSVKVDGDSATVRDCTKNFTYSVDQEAEPLTKPDPWYDVTGTLKREGGSWTVVKQVTKKPAKSCL